MHLPEEIKVNECTLLCNQGHMTVNYNYLLYKINMQDIKMFKFGQVETLRQDLS